MLLAGNATFGRTGPHSGRTLGRPCFSSSCQQTLTGKTAELYIHELIDTAMDDLDGFRDTSTKQRSSQKPSSLAPSQKPQAQEARRRGGVLQASSRQELVTERVAGADPSRRNSYVARAEGGKSRRRVRGASKSPLSRVYADHVAPLAHHTGASTGLGEAAGKDSPSYPHLTLIRRSNSSSYSSPCRSALSHALGAGSPSDFPSSALQPRPRCPSTPSPPVVEALAHRVLNLVGSKPYDRLIFVGPAMRAIAIVFRELQDLAASIFGREHSSVSREVKATVQGMRERSQRVTGRVQQPPLPLENRQLLTEERRETYSQSEQPDRQQAPRWPPTDASLTHASQQLRKVK